MWKKFEVWGLSFLKVIQAFHNVHIVLYIRFLAQWLGCRLQHIDFIKILDYWVGTPDIQNYAYSMKSLNNFQNALPSEF